jgi:tetratricopeptide (TPR) repeat protein
MGMTLATERQAVLALALFLSSAGSAIGQSVVGCGSANCTNQVQPGDKISQLRQDFATALRQFVAALAGFGGDGSAVRSSIESMDTALARWDEAIRTFETAPTPPARSAEMPLALGTVYMGRHRLNDALREFGEAVRLEPGRADGHTLMAMAYSLADKPADAALAFLRASAIEPDNPSTSYELARLRARMGQGKEAQSALRMFRESVQKQLAMTRTPDTASAPFERAGLLRQTAGELPFFPPALYSAGFALLTQGAYGEAIVQFRQAAAVDPLSADSGQASDRFQQGRSALRQGDLPLALRHLRSAVALDPGRTEAHRALGSAYWADGQYDRSIDELTAVLRANPNDERTWLALADVLATIGQFSRAEQVLKDALQVIPRSGQAHYDLGRLYQSLARYPEAVHQLEEAATLNPIAGLDPLYEMIGAIYVGQADFDHAVEAYAKRIDVNPNNAGAHRKLGEVHLRQDRDDEALAEFMATLLLDPRSSDAYSGIAQVHLRTGRYAEALEASRRAVELDPTLKEARYALGTALRRLGQVEEGTKQMEEFQRLHAEAMTSARRTYELERIKRDAAVSLANSEYEKAAGLLRQALPYESSAASTYLALGFALLAAGHHSEAVVNLQTASQLEPGADVHRYLAEAYQALGRLEESRSESDIYQQMIDRAKKERLRKMTGSP